jgi:tetratricopeptide (TPR) repeat protein
MIRPHDSEQGGQEPFDPRSLFLHMERSTRKVPPGDVGESQECYYDAMEARSEIEAYRLLSRALELDPGNTDAWLLMLGYHSPQSADEEIETLRRMVEMAEERLGEQAFTEFAGHFWGFHETRPYMRARAALADALHRAGRVESASAEMEAMLELNPGDNQGLRYRLLACHLALGKLADARKLFDRYPDEFDYNTVFAWAKVLERFLAGNPEEAAQAVAAAQKQNPASQPYVLGHRKVPKNPPDSYSPGSKEEAMCFADDLQTAWNAHLAAKKWLASLTSKKK